VRGDEGPDLLLDRARCHTAESTTCALREIQTAFRAGRNGGE
jgi:hypothetical protein